MLSQFSGLFPIVAGDASTKVAYVTPDAFAYTYLFGLLCRHVNILNRFHILYGNLGLDASGMCGDVRWHIAWAHSCD